MEIENVTLIIFFTINFPNIGRYKLEVYVYSIETM